MNDDTILSRLKKIFIGGARDPNDPNIFHKLSLIAFFAWIGLGADGLTSSAYGPEEAFRALAGHGNLAIFVAIASVITIMVVSAGYLQIIELFPSGGGGYLVASKLLSPRFGMVGGCALLIDYVLTISVSIASGADAIFSLLPPALHAYKLWFAVGGVVLLIFLNLRGVKESVMPLVPIFLTFIATHVFIILYGIISHLGSAPEIAANTVADVRSVSSEIGVLGLIFLLIRAYAMGAGTYTGIEAVSNGMSILREPRIQTGKRTMHYMAGSLAFMVLGLMSCYVLYQVQPAEGKTLNAILFDTMTSGWGTSGYLLLTAALASEAILLFVAAQTGFLGGPRIIANMAMDRWFPSKFATLSDRLVTQNGILLMGGAAIVTMFVSGGSVHVLVVLYSINVFITFVLSQMGMVRHWWQVRHKEPAWKRKLIVNGVGLILTGSILISVVIVKFFEGGWITLLVTTGLVILVSLIRRHYDKTHKLLKRLDSLVSVASTDMEPSSGMIPGAHRTPEYDPKSHTAVLLVNGFNGLGLHTLFGIIRLFRGVFKNFVFVQVGVVDAGVFKGKDELNDLTLKVKLGVDKYVEYSQHHGFFAEGYTGVGTDVVEEVMNLSPKIMEKYPNAVFFGGQIVFPEDFILSRWLHNYIVFAIQRRFYHRGIPFVILPIRV